MRPHSILTIATVVAALGTPRAAVSAEADLLERGIAFFHNMDDERATQSLLQLLTTDPPRAIAAKAHLYLGLIAFNDNLPDGADTEFKLALRANPAIELPPATSPKARLLWAEARNEVTREEEHPAAPAAATAETSAASHPGAAAIALGIAGVLLGATAVYGGVQVLNYQGTINQATAKPGTVSGSQLVSAHGAAQFWADAWIPFTVVGGGCLVGTAFTW